MFPKSEIHFFSIIWEETVPSLVNGSSSSVNIRLLQTHRLIPGEFNSVALVCMSTCVPTSSCFDYNFPEIYLYEKCSGIYQ